MRNNKIYDQVKLLIIGISHEGLLLIWIVLKNFHGICFWLVKCGDNLSFPFKYNYKDKLNKKKGEHVSPAKRQILLTILGVSTAMILLIGGGIAIEISISSKGIEFLLW